MQLLLLEESNKKNVIAKIRINNQEYLLAAFNKKRITDSEIIKTYRKAAELNLPYYVITKGDPTKKMKETMQAYRKLRGIGKIS